MMRHSFAAPNLGELGGIANWNGKGPRNLQTSNPLNGIGKKNDQELEKK